MRPLVMRAGAALSLVLAAVPATAQVDDFDARRKAAYDQLLVGLEEYSDWCRVEKLFLVREPVLHAILELEPEHDVSLKALGWTKKKGAWVEPRKPKTFKDYGSTKAKEAAPDRYQAALAPYMGALEELLGEDLSVDQRAQVYEDILRYDPDNATIHELRGDVQMDGEWVLAETVTAKKRRAELREIVRAAYQDVPRPTRIDPTAVEAAIELPWTAVYDTSTMRVAGTVENEELERMIQALHATVHTFNEVFGVQASLPEGRAVYLLSEPVQRKAFLAGHPELTDAERAAYAKLEGTGLQSTGDFAFWSDWAARRIDGIVGIALGWLLADAFGLTIEQAWAYEGFRLYLTRALVKTRLNWFVQPSETLDVQADRELKDRLMEGETNWMQEAFELMQEDDAPRLSDIVKKGSTQFTTEDLLFGYVLAAYFLEAKPDQTNELLRKLGKGAPPAITIEQTMGLDRLALERQIRRWLSERR